MIYAEGMKISNGKIYLIHPYGFVYYGDELTSNELNRVQVGDHIFVFRDISLDQVDRNKVCVFNPLCFRLEIIMNPKRFVNDSLVKTGISEVDDAVHQLMSKARSLAEDIKHLVNYDKNDLIRVRKIYTKTLGVDDLFAIVAFKIGMYFKNVKGYSDYRDRAIAFIRYLWCNPSKAMDVFYKDWSIHEDHCLSRYILSQRVKVWKAVKSFVIGL